MATRMMRLGNSGIIDFTGTQPSSGGIDTVQMAQDMSRMKARRYEFAYYDADDISQEIWLIVNKASEKYDSERTMNPKSFFNVATENALRNLKRDTRIVDNINIHDKPVDQLDNSFEEFLELRDLVEYLVVNIPKKLRKPFMMMINQGGDGLSSYTKSKIRDAVTDLLKKCRNE
jgi:hypothetical protein